MADGLTDTRLHRVTPGRRDCRLVVIIQQLAGGGGGGVGGY